MAPDCGVCGYQVHAAMADLLWIVWDGAEGIGSWQEEGGMG
jgi:hypothetical protein